jgi:hypothetical protein
MGTSQPSTGTYWIAAAVAAPLVALGCDLAAPPPTDTQPADTQTPTVYDEHYLGALAIADRFCEAWRAGDVSVGRMLLDRRLVRRYSDQQINDAIGDTPNPRHEAFEIFDGERIGDGRFAFQVRLFLRYTGQGAERIEAPVERLVVALGADGQWRVDDFWILPSPGR